MKRWLAAVAAIAVLALALHACRRDPKPATPATSPVRATPPASPPPQPAPTSAAAPAMTPAQADAMIAAADTVQRYLQLAGQDRRDEADALWARAPDPGREGGLRALLPARALRIRNEEPDILDGGASPRRVGVPVRVTLTANDGRAYAFSGRYVVERAASGADWRIVDADLHADIDGS